MGLEKIGSEDVKTGWLVKGNFAVMRQTEWPRTVVARPLTLRDEVFADCGKQNADG
jgi:hypothetical protein